MSNLGACGHALRRGESGRGRPRASRASTYKGGCSGFARSKAEQLGEKPRWRFRNAENIFKKCPDLVLGRSGFCHPASTPRWTQITQRGEAATKLRMAKPEIRMNDEVQKPNSGFEFHSDFGFGNSELPPGRA